MEFYVYGKTKQELIDNARLQAAKLDDTYDNKAQVTEVGTQTAGTMDYKIIYPINRL